MIDIPIIILAGGLATRLNPVTKTVPKILLDVDGKPFIYHQLELLNSNNINRVILSVGHLGEMVETVVGYSYKNINIEYSYDGPTLLGTGGAIKKSTSKVDNILGVLYGDSYLPINYTEVFDYYMKCNKSGLLTVYKNNSQYDTSNIIFEDGNILKYNKSELHTDMKHIDYGFSVFNKQVFQSNQPKFDLSEIIINLINEILLD
jgi:NDP-sugar pyrophosphorylase family protein